MLFKYDIQEDLQNTEGLNGDEQVLVITDTHTRALIRPTDYPTLVLRAGEAHKNLHSVEKIWDFLHTHEATRKSLLVCIGGGTVTDSSHLQTRYALHQCSYYAARDGGRLNRRQDRF